jgi:hypothetical protein
MKIEDLKFESQMVCHMALETAHLLKYEITIIAPGQFINGRKFYVETMTKKRKRGGFGKSETVYYFLPDAEVFSTAKDLINSIIAKT